jgi:hypothetical protein
MAEISQFTMTFKTLDIYFRRPIPQIPKATIPPTIIVVIGWLIAI